MAMRVDVDVSHITARLDAMLPSVHDALVKSLEPLAMEGADAARDIAFAHIHLVGTTKPGAYLASIYGGISDKGTRVTGFVRSASPLAHLLEYGVHIPAQDIFPDAKEVMMFQGGSEDVFARVVHFPGVDVPAYPAIHPALATIANRVEQVLTDAVNGVLN